MTKERKELFAKIMGVFVNPLVLIINISIGIWIAIVETYKQNVEIMRNL